MPIPIGPWTDQREGSGDPVHSSLLEGIKRLQNESLGGDRRESERESPKAASDGQRHIIYRAYNLPIV